MAGAQAAAKAQRILPAKTSGTTAGQSPPPPWLEGKCKGCQRATCVLRYIIVPTRRLWARPVALSVCYHSHELGVRKSLAGVSQQATMEARAGHFAACGPPGALVLPHRLLASLRARRGGLGRQGSRASIYVAERSELRASGSQEGSTPQPPPQAPLPSGPELLRQHLTPTQCEHVTHEILRTFLAVDGSSSCGNSRSRGGNRQPTGHAGIDRKSSGNGSQHEHGAEHGASSSSSSSSRGIPRQHSQASPKTSSRGSRGMRSSKGSESATGVAPAQQRRRGLQGQVAEHLLSGGFDEAMLEPVPTHTLNWVIKVLGEQQQPVLAEQLFHWMRVKGRANEFSFVKLCEACGSAGQPWRAFHAWRTVRRMPQAGTIMGSQAGAALVLCYRSTADHRAAAAALADLRQRGVAADRYAFNAAIRVCADAGADEEALRLLGTLREAAAAERAAPAARSAQHQGQLQAAARHGSSGEGAAGSASSSRGAMQPDCRSYSAALAALEAAGRQHRAVQLQRWMEEDGVVPDATLCTQFLACYAAAGQAAAAQAMFDLMAAASASLPNRTHWNVLLLAYAEARDVAGCAAAYRRMTGAAGLRPDCRTLVALLRAAFHAQLGLAAVRAVQAEMAAHNVQPNIQLATAMVGCLQHVAPTAGAPPLRLQLQGTAEQGQQAAGRTCGQQPAMPAHAGSSLQQSPLQQPPGPAGDHRAACVAEARAIVARQREQWGRRRRALDVRLYNALMAVQLAAGDHEGVLQTFQELEGEERLLPDRTTLTTAIAACRAAGWQEREAQFRRLMQSSHLLGALGGADDSSRSSGGGSGSGGRPGKRRWQRHSHSGSGGRTSA